jgi:DNA helicase HerA-like ATPase
VTDVPVSSVPEGLGSPAQLTAVGHSAQWHGPGYPTFETGVPHAFVSREVLSAPRLDDLMLRSGDAPWQVMRSTAMAMLADGAFMAGCDSLEVRYIVTPASQGSSRVRMFLTAMSKDWRNESAEAAVTAACQKLPVGFTFGIPTQQLSFGMPEDQIDIEDTVLELRRLEQVTYPQWDYIPAEYYYTIEDTFGDGSGWPAFWRSLSNVKHAVTVSLLFANTYLHPEERNTLAKVLTDLYILSDERTDYDIMYNPVIYPACMNARKAMESWQRRLDQLERPLLGRVTVRSHDWDTAAAIATSLATAASINSESLASHPMVYQSPREISDVRQAEFSYHWMEHLPWGGHQMWGDESAPTTLRRLPYLFGLHEAASLLVLPVPDAQGVAGMPTARSVVSHRESLPEAAEEVVGVRLGSSLHEGQLASAVSLPLKALNRHTLVVGSPGSGKTTTVMSMLARLWRTHRIPFLVIESVKTEYRSLADLDGLDDLQVITLGNESVAPLRLNPLAPPPGVRCEVHQSAVMAALKLALPLFPPQPQILAKALERTYRKGGWDDETTAADGIAPPTLRDLKGHYKAVFDEIGYTGEAKNIGLAFETRLESLLQGSRGKLLDTVHSSDFDLLLAKPTVIELNEIHDTDERSVLSAFLLDRVRAAAKQRVNVAGQLRHVTVLEEAHRLLARSFVGSGNAESGDQARADSVRAFCEAIAELRSLGEGFILSSQTPSALAQAAIANTGVRIVHRLESGEDRDVMMKDMGADERARDIAARLRQGEAIARWPERDEVEVVKVESADGVNSARAVPDEIVALRMVGHRQGIRQLLPYQLCTPDVCTSGCAARTRRAGADLAETVATTAGAAWKKASAERLSIDTVVDVLVSGHTDEQTCYCSAVHLSIHDIAFQPSGNLDSRPLLAAKVREAILRRVTKA